MTDDEKKSEDGLHITFLGGSFALTGDTVKLIAPYIGKCLLIASIAYLMTVVIGAFK